MISVGRSHHIHPKRFADLMRIEQIPAIVHAFSSSIKVHFPTETQYNASIRCDDDTGFSLTDDGNHHQTLVIADGTDTLSYQFWHFSPYAILVNDSVYKQYDDFSPEDIRSLRGHIIALFSAILFQTGIPLPALFFIYSAT